MWTLAGIFVLLLALALPTARRLLSRKCPACGSRQLAHVSTLIADGTSRETSGAFTLYKCRSCDARLQRHFNDPIGIATEFADEFDRVESPT